MTELTKRTRRSWVYAVARWHERLRRRASQAKTRQGKPRPGDASGMTLIEIMVVVAIIGLMMGGVAVMAFNKFKKAQLVEGKKTVSTIVSAIEHFALDNTGQTCPKELDELVKDGQIKKVPKDPWGEDLLYKCPGENDTEGADVSSKGPDKKEGTDDDINSWEL